MHFKDLENDVEALVILYLSECYVPHFNFPSKAVVKALGIGRWSLARKGLMVEGRETVRIEAVGKFCVDGLDKEFPFNGYAAEVEVNYLTPLGKRFAGMVSALKKLEICEKHGCEDLMQKVIDSLSLEQLPEILASGSLAVRTMAERRVEEQRGGNVAVKGL